MGINNRGNSKLKRLFEVAGSGTKTQTDIAAELRHVTWGNPLTSSPDGAVGSGFIDAMRCA